MLPHLLNITFLRLFNFIGLNLFLLMFMFSFFKASAQTLEINNQDVSENLLSSGNFFSEKITNRKVISQTNSGKKNSYLEQRVSDLESSVWQLRNRYNNLRRNLKNSPSTSNFADSSDMFIRFTQMEEMIRQLVGKNQLLEHEIGILNTKIEQLMLNPDYRLSKSFSVKDNKDDANIVSVPLDKKKDRIGSLLEQNNEDSSVSISHRMVVPNANNLYQLFSSHIEEHLYEDAQDLADNFVKHFPKHENASATLYTMGNIHFEKKDFKKAASNYLRVYVDYGENKEAPLSFYKLGLSLIELKEKQQGCAALYSVKKKYPDINKTLEKQIGEALKNNAC